MVLVVAAVRVRVRWWSLEAVVEEEDVVVVLLEMVSWIQVRK